MGQKLTVNAAGPSGCRVLNAHLASFFFMESKNIKQEETSEVSEFIPHPEDTGAQKG